MLAQFEPAHARTNRIEDFYSNDPHDSGKETLYGISRAKNPNASIWALVDKYKKLPNFPENMRGKPEILTAELAWYKMNVWDLLQLGKVQNQIIAQEIYDSAVNCGTKRAAEWLQTALTVSNNNAKYYPDLVIDGIIGNQTIDALNKHPRPFVVYKLLNTLQGNFYVDITLSNPENERFINGWFDKRVFEDTFK